MTAVFQANSLNYGEGVANISELKKMHRDNGEVYTFASRQSIRYDIVRLGNELFGWNLNTVEKLSGNVVQFRKDVTIDDSVEMDLFGYLKTDKVSQKRPAAARLSHSVSLEPYKSDLEFLNNMGMAARIGQTPNLANIEQHQSFYTYTMTVDLHRVGIDEGITLPNEERAKRVVQLLEILKVLNRDIRGRRENLSPLFVVGGVYDFSNPLFLGMIQLSKNSKGWSIRPEPIASAASASFLGHPVKEQTRVGVVHGFWDNEKELLQAFGEQLVSVDAFFSHLQDAVHTYYGA